MNRKWRTSRKRRSSTKPAWTRDWTKNCAPAVAAENDRQPRKNKINPCVHVAPKTVLMIIAIYIFYHFAKNVNKTKLTHTCRAQNCPEYFCQYMFFIRAFRRKNQQNKINQFIPVAPKTVLMIFADIFLIRAFRRKYLKRKF